MIKTVLSLCLFTKSIISKLPNWNPCFSINITFALTFTPMLVIPFPCAVYSFLKEGGREERKMERENCWTFSLTWSKFVSLPLTFQSIQCSSFQKTSFIFISLPMYLLSLYPCLISSLSVLYYLHHIFMTFCYLFPSQGEPVDNGASALEMNSWVYLVKFLILKYSIP